MASKAANSTTAQAMVGRRVQKDQSPRPEALWASTVGAPVRPSSSSEPPTSRPVPVQKPRSLPVPRALSSSGPESWLRA
ncbi:hypothetical protein D9M68_660230 [compost metagenome]